MIPSCGGVAEIADSAVPELIESCKLTSYYARLARGSRMRSLAHLGLAGFEVHHALQKPPNLRASRRDRHVTEKKSRYLTKAAAPGQETRGRRSASSAKSTRGAAEIRKGRGDDYFHYYYNNHHHYDDDDDGVDGEDEEERRSGGKKRRRVSEWLANER